MVVTLTSQIYHKMSVIVRVPKYLSTSTSTSTSAITLELTSTSTVRVPEIQYSSTASTSTEYEYPRPDSNQTTTQSYFPVMMTYNCTFHLHNAIMQTEWYGISPLWVNSTLRYFVPDVPTPNCGSYDKDVIMYTAC